MKIFDSSNAIPEKNSKAPSITFNFRAHTITLSTSFLKAANLKSGSSFHIILDSGKAYMAILDNNTSKVDGGIMLKEKYNTLGASIKTSVMIAIGVQKPESKHSIVKNVSIPPVQVGSYSECYRIML